jgi:hypothetical protein
MKPKTVHETFKAMVNLLPVDTLHQRRLAAMVNVFCLFKVEYIYVEHNDTNTISVSAYPKVNAGGIHVSTRHVNEGTETFLCDELFGKVYAICSVMLREIEKGHKTPTDERTLEKLRSYTNSPSYDYNFFMMTAIAVV